jgi:predicted CXXCH cytochrome family protein
MTHDALQTYRKVAMAAAVLIVLAVPIYVLKESIIRALRNPAPSGEATFVGRERCIVCHREAYEKWLGSDHDRAMEIASDSTVLGNFNDVAFQSGAVAARFYKKNGKFFVRTAGPSGAPGDFEIAFTFGFEPLQQYLVPFPGGRLQALTIAWNTERKEWFSLYPGQNIPASDWLHWTRNAQNWNGMCAECHSTNLVKNYDADTKTFRTTWSEIDVSCEACHGPGSRHVAWAELPPMARPETENYGHVLKTVGLEARDQVELCAPCHSRRTELGDYDHTTTRLMDNFVPALLEEGLYHSDGQILEEVYEYASFEQSKMFRNGVRCSDCHDVHGLELVKEGNALCLQCHQAEVYDSYDHHFHKEEHEGKPSAGRLCVKCHMPERPYMVVDRRSDHSMRVPRPDLSARIEVPNACGQSSCHDDKPISWSAEHYAKWYGIARKPHYGTTLAAGRRGRPEAKGELARLAGDALYPAIVRATALRLLEKYPGDESTAAFNRALSDDDALIRFTAVERVNAEDPRTLKELVAPLLFDPVRAVRTQAAVRLAGLDDGLFKPYQREALEAAISEYEAAMTRSLDFASAAYNLGNLYARLKDAARAEKSYRTAIEIDDLFYPAKANLAVIYNTQGRNAEAERLLREILDAYPEQHESAYSLGLLLAEMNRLDEAAKFLAAAAEGMPERARVLYNLGLTCRKLGRTEEAEAALARATDLDPAEFDFMYALADFYVRRGEYRKAKPLVERMQQTRPGDPATREISALVGSALGSVPPPDPDGGD